MKRQFEGVKFIQKVEYDEETKEMLITMQGYKNKYACVNVPLEVYEGFEKAESKGTYFNNVVKGKFLHEYFS